MSYFEPLTTNHRVTIHGRLLRCPHCKHVTRTYHLGFSALQCFHCKTMVKKYDWTIGPNVTRKDLQKAWVVPQRAVHEAKKRRSTDHARAGHVRGD